MPRETWTDERLDDLSKRVDDGFREVKAEIRSTRTELKGEIESTRVELKGEIDKLSDRFDRLNDRFDRLTYTLIAALIGLVVTHYLG